MSNAWFNYYSNTSDFNADVLEVKSSFLRRKIDLPTPNLEINENTLLRVEVSNFKLNKVQLSDLTYIQFDHNYLVVFQSDESFTPVRSLIYNEYLYFESGVKHQKDIDIAGSYYIYYGKKFIKYIYETEYQDNIVFQEHSSEEIEEFINGANSDYSLSVDELDKYIENVFVDDYGYYSISFTNSTTDWTFVELNTNPSPIDIETSTKKYTAARATVSGAKCYGRFSGKIFQLYAFKTRNSGSFRIRFYLLQDENLQTILTEWLDIDLFDQAKSEKLQKAELVYSKSDFEDTTYLFEIENLSNKQINIYNFAHSPFYHLSVGLEERNL